MQRILVVDDERLVADTLSLIFERCGFACEAAYSVDAALASARKQRPDLLVCDITMPQRDGMELIEAMSKEFPECRVLALSGYSNNLRRVEEASESLRYPAGALAKPCHPAHLLREAGAMLAGVERQRISGSA